MSHTTVVAYDGNCWHQSGCLCGWTGPRRTMAQVALGDALLHKAQQPRAATITMGSEDCPMHTNDLKGVL